MLCWRFQLMRDFKKPFRGYHLKVQVELEHDTSKPAILLTIFIWSKKMWNRRIVQGV